MASNFVVIDGGRPALVLETAARRLRTLDGGAAARRAGCRWPARSRSTRLMMRGGHGEPAGSRRSLALGFERDAERLRRSPLSVKPLPDCLRRLR